MPIDYLADWDRRLERQDAMWTRQIIDRPVVCAVVAKERPEWPWPKERSHRALRDRWMDAGWVAERALAGVMNSDYLGDALPHAWPNLGPEVFSAFFGCELEFGEETSWSVPMLKDWSEAGKVRFSEDNVYWKKIVEITEALLAVGAGKFYTGITDMHPGGDAIAAFRDPVQLNYDMVEHLDEVKRMLRYVTDTYLKVYDFYHDKLRAAGQPISTWAGIVSSRSWLVPSNDFSCMISPRMFEEVFLQSIVEECRHYEASLYHLDGPAALKHLDALLGIRELSAIQWVYGAGHGRASDWLPVYRRCQAAGKGLELHLEPDELDLFMDNLRPEGLCIHLAGVRNREEAEALIRRVARWPRGD
jgi:hypothetical protein